MSTPWRQGTGSRFGFRTYGDFPGWDGANELISEVIDREAANTVLEVGGGRSPTLSIDEVQARELEYSVNDIDRAELDLVDPRYDRLCFDMATTVPPDIAPRRFDVVFSRMVNEHVVDGRRYHTNIFNLLAPGGTAVHMFATLFATPFVANRLLPESVADRILDLLFAENPDAHEKFRARYSWCRGPTKRMLQRFRSIGFEVDGFYGYFGHGYYIRLGPLHRLESTKARWLTEHPIPVLTSYAMVELRRPKTS